MSKGKGPWDGKEGEEEAVPGNAPAAQPPETRSPWQAEGDASSQRRSAHIDDIFRSRSAARAALGSAPLRRGLIGWIVAAVMAGAMLATTLHVLGDGEEGVVSRLGRYHRTTGPGLSVTLPWPFEQVQVFQVSQIRPLVMPEKPGETLMLTRDGELIDLAFQVRWRISDLSDFAFRIKDPELAIRDLAEAEMRAGAAETRFDPLWDGSRRGEVAERVRQRMQAVLDAWHAGVRIEGVEITKADPPGKLADAFLKIANARDSARKAREGAEQWAANTLANAQVEAAEFDAAYAQYRAAPQATRTRMYYQTMEQLTANAGQVVVSGAQASINVAGPVVQPDLPQPAASPAGGQ